MKVLLYGKNAKDIEELVKDLGFEIVVKNPEVIISFGGDGTLLSSEKEYPQIPKIPIRNSLICNKCPIHQEKVLLKALLEKKLQLKEYRKLETKISDQSLIALNDFVIRNTNPVHTIRFKIPTLNNKLLLGDGIVVSTVFGSSGYFKSITQKTFTRGFGLAFNNTTEKLEPIFFKENEQVTFKLVRGYAALTYDNSHDQYPIRETSEITFKLSAKKAKIYIADSLRCPNCQVRRG